MLYLSHPACLEHDPRAHMPAHPDTPERLEAIEEALSELDWLGWERRLAPAAAERDLELVHTRRHVEAIRDLCAGGGGAVDADTFVGETSYRAALHAAGAACEMTRALLAGEDSVGFCAIRPSGHHAEPDRAMGFCLFDNVAVAAAKAIEDLGLERVLVLDWDVHHGNGTAEAFRRRADVLVVDIHQDGIYPGTGAAADFGSGPGQGYTVNLPVPAGSGEALWLSLLEHIVEPIAASFSPQLVLVSAGFDAHHRDPLAGGRLETGSFSQMACRARELAAGAGAPLGVVLEGGYHPPSLVESLVATLRALGGEGEPESAAPEEILTSRAAANVAPFWSL
jgi:acetoin utilization deacetylase AcuC-like enzyme